MSINRRFGELLKHLNMSIKEAAEVLGKQENYIKKLLREGESFGITPVIEILNSIENVNANWLLTGKGNMFLTENNSEHIKEGDRDIINRLIKEKEIVLFSTFKDLKDENKDLIKEIGVLEDRINKLEKRGKSEQADTYVTQARKQGEPASE